MKAPKPLTGHLVAWLLLLLTASPALAQTGVSDDRVSLPGGPGSLEGLGDNASINTNMGTMSHSIPIMVSQGFGATTPNLSLSYSSGSPSHILGMGWSMPIPAIERMTYRG
ncbi:MAG: SpvB/TcaC N-terminal domain-containing protein, partial [Myxococcota bacterium]